MQPIIRSINEASLQIARVELGVIAVPDQIVFENVSSEKATNNIDKSYQGVMDIDHDDRVADQTESISESTEAQESTGRQVHNHYIEGSNESPKHTLKELEDLYPNESPLLAPN